jgi:hypothetical protein
MSWKPRSAVDWCAVELDDHLVRDGAEGRRRADRGGEHDLAAGKHVAGLDHRELHLAEEAVAHGLRQHRQVHVEELHLAGVDLLPQVRIGLVGRAEEHRVGLGQLAVERRAGRGTGHHADLERAARGVLRPGAGGDRLRHDFRRAGGREPAETNDISVLNQRGGLVSGEERKGQGHRWRTNAPSTIAGSVPKKHARLGEACARLASR